jgi:hypothetical protein
MMNIRSQNQCCSYVFRYLVCLFLKVPVLYFIAITPSFKIILDSTDIKDKCVPTHA